MSILIMRFIAPMQSWGTKSRFTIRDTGLEPSKSGVIGLICAAMGRDRSADISDLNSLIMAVRIDQEGIMKRDYHTALNVLRADTKGKGTVVSERYYLSDAAFLVALEGDIKQLQIIQQAIKHPVWVLYFGRKSFVPSYPVYFPDDQAFIEDKRLYQVMKDCPSIVENQSSHKTLRVVMEVPYGSTNEIRNDVPLSFAEREFAIRYVETYFVSNPQNNHSTTG